MRKLSILLLLCILHFETHADEGMWLPQLLKQLNEQDMQSKGMKLSAEDIYSVNNSSLKDAVVIFGGGCTGELISSQGLLLTNHHCGYSQIQARSTVENNYLKNGFWAYKPGDEIPCPGLSVTFINRIEDVTDKIATALHPNMPAAERDVKIKQLSTEIESEAVKGTHYSAVVKPFYNGNQFYMIIMETFKDVRLAGTPPNSIGKFGGDTDNWMWPRHTGDFSLFRIYAGKDNKPSAYSPENKPFVPKHFFPVSLKGVNEGDFTMVFGFPGTTRQYIPSYAVRNIIESFNPVKIKIRDTRLDIINSAMQSGDKLFLQYASKQSSIANAWKKWQGELKGLKRLNTVAEKEKEEKAFMNWAIQNNKTVYASLFNEYEKAYKEYTPLQRTADYINEAAYGAELIKYARAFNKLVKPGNDRETTLNEASKLLSGMNGFYKDYDIPTDKRLFAAMMKMYYNDVATSQHPAALDDAWNRHKGNMEKFAGELYAKSIFTDSSKLRAILLDPSEKNLKKIITDPAYMLADGFAGIYSGQVEKNLAAVNARINDLNRLYMAGRMEMNPGQKFYPDANSTLRVAYGKVEGYQPADAVKYKHYTTLKGIMEKEDPSLEEFEVPEKLKMLFEKKDFGEYAHNGELPVAFVASNHTTGGNSGSPVINATGELVGTNFDRVWEGTMSDIDFDPERCRNISIDIRYTLFIIDKFAGCQRLIDEMKIIK